MILLPLVPLVPLVWYHATVLLILLRTTHSLYALPWTPHQVLFFLFFFLNTLNMDFFEKKTPFFGCFLFQSSLFHKFLCGTQYTLYLLTMSYDALTTAGRHLLSAEAFSFADDGKDAIKDFEWSAFSFFFCVFYQKASGRRGPPPFFPRTG